MRFFARLTGAEGERPIEIHGNVLGSMQKWAALQVNASPRGKVEIFENVPRLVEVHTAKEKK